MRTKVLQEHTAGPTSEGAPVDSVIKTIGLGRSYDQVVALRDLNLTVPRNSIFGFLGPNGAGKTTAIKLLLGLSRPTQGRAVIFGMDSVRDSLAVRTRIGYLAQDPRFYSHLTARETLEFTARFFYKGPSVAIQDRIEETIDLVGLRDKADRPIKGFSGGERQRLGIAQAQVNYPDLLILDEPAAALDPLGRRDVLEVMERLRPYTTIFYSTHILDDVQRVSDHVAILDRGRLVANAPTSELLDGSGADEITVRGDGETTAAMLRALPWVTDVRALPSNGSTTLTVGVSDDEAAESQLLRTVLAQEDVVVTNFGRKRFNLEDVFLRLVEGNQT